MRDAKLKLYGCAALFLLLTALRIWFPEQAGQAQAWMDHTLDPQGSFRAAALTLGRELDTAGLKDGMVAVFRLGEEAFG